MYNFNYNLRDHLTYTPEKWAIFGDFSYNSRESRKICCRVLGFHRLIISEHSTHTPRCSTPTPRCFVSEFPGGHFSGDHFSRVSSFRGSFFRGPFFRKPCFRDSDIHMILFGLDKSTLKVYEKKNVFILHNFPGGHFPGDHFSRGPFFSGIIFPRTIFPGGDFSENHFSRGPFFPGTIFLEYHFSGDHFSRGPFFRDSDIHMILFGLHKSTLKVYDKKNLFILHNFYIKNPSIFLAPPKKRHGCCVDIFSEKNHLKYKIQKDLGSVWMWPDLELFICM